MGELHSLQRISMRTMITASAARGPAEGYNAAMSDQTKPAIPVYVWGDPV